MKQNRCSIFHTVASLHPRDGGPSRTVVHLADFLANDPEFRVFLITQGYLNEPSVASVSTLVERRVCQSTNRISLSLGLPIKAELSRLNCIEGPIIVHNHGVWLPVNHWAAASATRMGANLIIHPRGMLEPWCLSHKALRKRVAMSLFQRSDLHFAKALVATSVQEFENLRSLGFNQPIAIIPNGVDVSWPTSLSISRDIKRNPERIALFLSRIHPKKGLLNLIHAWAQARPAGWKLQIAGPDEEGHLNEVLELAKSFHLGDCVQYLGELDGKAKADAYLRADLFVLPSFSENFGVVVAEALSYGVPVITTHGTPWSELSEIGCGWWIPTGVTSLVIALREATQLQDEERIKMGELGRLFVMRYNWQEIANQMGGLYRWIVGRGDKPSYIHTR